MVRTSLLVAAGLALATPAISNAQYFGRNKVQYESFQFQILRTAHFDVYFYEGERVAAEHAARMAERWYARLSSLLGHEMSNRQPLILYADHPDFEQTNVLSDQPSEGTGGVTESLKRRIILPLAAGLAESDHVLGHELVHAFQYDITGVGRGSPGMQLNRIPLWFIEGMAEYLSVGPEDAHTAMWMREAVRRNDLPDLNQLANPRYFPYRYGQAFWAYIGGTYGDTVVGEALRIAAKAGDAGIALAQATGVSPDKLVEDWHGALRDAAAPVAAATGVTLPAPDAVQGHGRAESPQAAGSRRVAGGGDDQQLYLAPALSPDGSRMVYFSDASLFAIELFLADAATGKPIRKLVSVTRDPHLESLQFINSAGAWDAAGERVAFGAVVHGKPALQIVRAKNGASEHEILLPTLGEIFNPSWSPDGKAIAFSAQVGGVTDLFVYRLDAKRLDRLTNDAYADLQPAWSPDGRTIAFVTDRFSTSLAQLDYGNYRLALFDVSARRAMPLQALPEGKHINPQWSPDGNSLFFLGDRGAVTNIYRLDLAAATLTQVTNLFSGVSGITALSPALSVAQKSGRVMYTLYTGDGFALETIEDRAVLAGTAPQPLTGRAAMLPPANRAPGGVPARLADIGGGLPPATPDADSIRPYRSRFSLDLVAQPSLAVGADRYGAYFGGGATLYWSDMLGDHNLITMAQVSGSIENFTALVGYENRKRRLNWGIAAQQSPYAVGQYRSYFQTIGGQQALVEELEILREINREVSLRAAYPLSRSRRLEMWTGGRHISYQHEIERTGVLSNGRTVLDTTIEMPPPSSLMLGTAAVALVHDNSFFGAASPILGQRWRLEGSSTFGSINYVTALVDYRRYFMPVRPFTLAGRLLHVGRYGPDAEDARIQPMFLGYPHLVRGYDQNSFTASECGSGATTGCPVYDQLLGSRIVVANAELRFPLFGVLGLGSGYYGALPIEAGLFYDAGLAWSQTTTGNVVMSAGTFARMNLFGFAIAQLDVVRPFQRPQQDWMVRFTLTQGF